MSFFDDDPFESIIDEFFGQNRGTNIRRRQFISGEEEDREIDYIEDKSNVYLVFELPGYTEKDIMVVVKDNILTVQAKKITPDNIQPYLAKKLNQGVQIRKELPNFINTKKFTQTIKNGVLEIKFKKK